MNWEAMTPEQRDILVHTEIMQRTQEPCQAGQLDPFMGSYWLCSCGWVSDFYIGEGSTEHTIPVPRYTQSMDAAWLVVEHFKGATLHVLLPCVTYYKAPDMRYSVKLYKDSEYNGYETTEKSMPLAICKAALQGVGVDVN